MKKRFALLALSLVAASLYGCPETRLPKTPPNVPEPKAVSDAAAGLKKGAAPRATPMFAEPRVPAIKPDSDALPPKP